MATKDHNGITFEIDPEMIWSIQLDDDSIQLYLNEEDYLTFTLKAAKALHNTLSQALAKWEVSNGNQG